MVMVSLVDDFFKDKSIFITGSNGFVGQHLLSKLTDCGAKISTLCREYRRDENSTQYQGDIRDAKFVMAAILKCQPDHIFHLAGDITRSSSAETFSNSIDINLNGTLNILMAAQQVQKLKSTVVMGTIDEYGECDFDIEENIKARPFNAYSFSKYCATELSKIFNQFYDVNTVVLRPTLIYGPMQNVNMMLPDLICHLLDNKLFAMSEGKQTRDFIYIDDVINACLTAALTQECYGETFNIGSGQSSEIIEVAKTVEILMKKKNLLNVGAMNYRPNEIMTSSVSIEKAKALLGWKPVYSLEQGLQKTIEFYKNEKRTVS
jgi:nucleoside-diphosphate-sugar epimerase